MLYVDSIFLVCALSIYLYIFIKIRKNRINQVSLKRLECSNSLDTTQCEIIASNNNTTNDTNNTTNDTNNNNNNKNNTNNNNNSNGNRITKKVKPTKSGLFTPVLLVASFCLFFIVPDQMYFWAIEIGIQNSNYNNSGFLLYQVGMLLDAFIYIFFQREIRKTAARYLKKIF